MGNGFYGVFNCSNGACFFIVAGFLFSRWQFLRTQRKEKLKNREDDTTDHYEAPTTKGHQFKINKSVSISVFLLFFLFLFIFSPKFLNLRFVTYILLIGQANESKKNLIKPTSKHLYLFDKNFSIIYSFTCNTNFGL